MVFYGFLWGMAMRNTVAMNVYLHFLLVIKQMNDFTVSEAKDVLLQESTDFTDSVETRKFIYRQLTRNVTKGLLERTEKLTGDSKKVLYSKTALFFTTTLEATARGRKTKKAKTRSVKARSDKAMQDKSGGNKAKRSKTSNSDKNGTSQPLTNKDLATLPKVSDYQAVLTKELHAYEIDLNTIIEEAKEYKRLSARFPKLQAELQQHHSQAKTKSINLLGKIHALQNLLGYTPTRHESC